MRMRRVAAGLAALAAAGGLSGCAVGSAVQSTIDPSAEARTVNLAALKTAHLEGFRITGTMTLNTGDHLMTTRFSGALNIRQQIESVRERFRIAGRTVTIRDMYHGAMAYTDLSQLPGFPHGQRHWFSLNLSQAFGTPVPATGNPAEFVNFLRAPGLHASSLGVQSANGVAATLYRVDQNLPAYVRGVPRRLRRQAALAANIVERATGSKTLSEDVWVDATGLIRQISYGFTECVAGQPLTTSLLMDFSHFGRTPRFTLPGPAQSTSMTAGTRAALQRVRELPLGCGSPA